jgi:hypothetical protein
VVAVGQGLKEGERDGGHIDGEDEDGGVGMGEGGEDADDRAEGLICRGCAGGQSVREEGYVVEVDGPPIWAGAADDERGGAEGMEEAGGGFEEGFAVDEEFGFVGAHTGALAAGEEGADEGGVHVRSPEGEVSDSI